MIGEKNYLLSILKVQGLGPLKLTKLKDRLNTYEEIWNTPREMLSEIIGHKLASSLHEIREQQGPAEELEKCRQAGIGVLAYFESDYPESFRVIHTPPPLIFYQGDIKVLDIPAVGIVGSRQATPYGRTVARRLAGELAEAGFVVVSGMARGIDSESHRGCLDAGGKTIGVLGNGVDVVYPRENRSLYMNVRQQGLLLSEFYPGTTPEPGHFPIRNRLISALSRGIVVVEAQAKSGAMITVGFALEQGKDVFAVPGPITSGYSRGPHQLLQEGARLVTGVDDILDEWGIEKMGKNLLNAKTDERSSKVLRFIGFEPIHIDQIVDKSEISVGEIAAELLRLEIEGKIKCLPGNTYVRI
ncbi:MAG: DNA-protecting protein DprA [Syntrophomonadaceae bacterium]|nr:DNA-protecting protein DprA [Syntrophomonadaceae bacterium]